MLRAQRLVKNFTKFYFLIIFYESQIDKTEKEFILWKTEYALLMFLSE